MLFGLTRAGIGDVGSDEEFIKAAANYGFQAVDGNPISFVERNGKQAAVAFLERHHVKWSSFGLPVDWRTTDEAFRNDLPKLATAAKAAHEIGCTSCCTYILPSTDLEPAAFMALAIKRLRLCAQLLGAYNIRLGLEYVGPHHLRTMWKHPFIWTQSETLDLIAAIGEPNVGLLLDTYHWYTTEMSAADIAKLNPYQIVHVHINDARDVPLKEALDNDRVYPGEGVIDIAEFLQALQKTGYQGAVTQEVLTKSPPTEAACDLLRRSQSGMEKVIAAAGITQ